MVVIVLLGLGMTVFGSALVNAALDDSADTAPTTLAPRPSYQPTQVPSLPPTQATQQPTASERPTASPRPTATQSAKQPRYQNDDYRAQPPPKNPPPVPYPRSNSEANVWLVRNSLYGQSTPKPIRCSLTTINPQTASRAQLQAHLNELTACLMKEWDRTLAAAGYTAIRPPVTIYTQPVQTPCGRIDVYNAYYCSGNQWVYYSPNIIELFPPRVAASRLAVLLVMAHEFGHAIQGRIGIMTARVMLGQNLSKSQALASSRRMELQADCFAGAFVGSMATALGLSEDDRKILAAQANALGDDVLRRDPNYVGDHGLGTNRVSWVFTGIDHRGTLAACNTWVAPDQKVR